MASIVDEYLDGSIDNDDVFPCKGCGEILEEGKAFELAGNRWHLDCFRCNTCGTLLDSDANLLLLGDGSLICNNCTYSCSACGNKIEDLAILTGDQAFCSTCFRCRNCKRKIENLRYARTSQGIFCMGCHETLMARRRKKSKAAAAARAREQPDHSPSAKEKSLPALPPSAIPPNAFSNDRVDPDSDTPTETPTLPRPAHTHTESSSRGVERPPRSPERWSETSAKPEGLAIPPQSHRRKRQSMTGSAHESSANESADGFFIPVALDPSPGTGATPRSMDSVADPKRKDYFEGSKPGSTGKRSDSRAATPHIAFQDKGRKASSDYDSKPPSRRHSRSSRPDASTSPAINERHPHRPTQSRSRPSNEEFRLQDAPRTKQLADSRANSQSSSLVRDRSPAKSSNGVSRKQSHPSAAHSEPRMSNDDLSQSRNSTDSKRHAEDDARASIDSASRGQSRSENTRAIARKELPSSASRNANGKAAQPNRPLTDDAVAGTRRAPGRPSAGEPREARNASDTYMLPRNAPLPPRQHEGKESVSSVGEPTSPKPSPKLPRWSGGADFSMEEDMARILGSEDHSSSLFRRVSNAVRHGRTNSDSGTIHSRVSHARSISETTRATTSPRWPKRQVADDRTIQQQDITSPFSVSSADDPASLKRQLRNSEQRVAELERQFNTEKDLKSLNRKLMEKRKTVSVLDTQTEIMIKQLEVLAGYVEKAKETKSAIDVDDLEDSAIKEFVQKLERVKISMSEAIEQLHEQRDQVLEEKKQAMADRDRALMEFEQLSSKNAQLADMNNDLTHQIQERFKSQMGDAKFPNGLGIYGHNKAATGSSLHLDSGSVTTGAATLVPADEEPIVETGGPTVVQVRKGQVRKFNWKKGSKTMAQNVAKGVNRAVVAFQNDRERHQMMMGGDIGVPYNTTVAAVEPMAGPPAGAVAGRPQGGDPGRQGFGFFSKKNAALSKTGSSPMAIVPDIAEPPSVLFGSELSERVDYERRQIPYIVTRCIEEVELRGMDQEGIYRKTGGNSQVNAIKEGLDKSESFDLSDPDLDITAVTSVLKQYFRKLPTPLLTFDVYDQVLESNALSDETERCDHLRKTFATMPQSHRDCLEFLMFHLDRVAQRESENLMTPKNLSVVFAPTVMRDLNIEREMTDMHSKNLAVQFIIEKSKIIFDDGA